MQLYTYVYTAFVIYDANTFDVFALPMIELAVWQQLIYCKQL